MLAQTGVKKGDRKEFARVVINKRKAVAVVWRRKIVPDAPRNPSLLTDGDNVAHVGDAACRRGMADRTELAVP